MDVKMLLSDKLKEVLKKNGVEKYQPAYDGESAALDLYYCGITTQITSYEMNEFLSTGLKVIIPNGYVGIIKERGSITKYPMTLRAGVIDVGYHDEIFVNLICHEQSNNYGTSRVQLSEGSKLPVQLVVIPCLNKYTEVDDETFKKLSEESKRKDGKVGSSDGKY